MSAVLDQYFTPDRLARRIVEWTWDGADVPRGTHILEPSAGAGAFVRHIPKNVRLTALDIDPEMVRRLEAIRRPGGYTVHQAEFGRWPAQRGVFDLAIMNPPYGGGADGRHVARAARLCPRVVALVRANFVLGKDRFHDLFRWCRLTRVAVLVRRPNFVDAAGEPHGGGPRHDFVVIEVVRREGDRLERTGDFEVDTDETQIEWWLDKWAA